MFKILSLLLLALADELDAPSIPNCKPTDTQCLTKYAQYTVVGQIMSNTLENGTTSSNYNATMRVRCMWASFTSPPSAGTGLVDKTINVINWGFPKPKCGGADRGAKAEVGDNKIYFLHVAKRAPSGAPPESILFSISDICVGGVSLDGKSDVAQVVADYPNNAIQAANMGSDPFCSLPALSQSNNAASAGASSTNGGFDPTKSNAIDRVAFGALAAFITAGVLLAF